LRFFVTTAALQVVIIINPLMTIVPFLGHDLYSVNARFRFIVSYPFWFIW